MTDAPTDQRRCPPLLPLLIATWLVIFAGTFASGQVGGDLPETGRALYENACAACHGSDGRGAPAHVVGFDTPLPDFSDCEFAPREADGDWYYVTAEGGPARGFSEIMPAFGDALTDEQIQKTLNHIRTFCTNKDWPRGELNLPRPLKTTKAYPEDEVVFSSTFESEGLGKVTNELIYEKRIGERNQFELIFPFGWAEQPASGGTDTDWRGAIEDVGVGFKRVMLHSYESGSIVSLGGEVFFNTGDKDDGLGSGTTIFEPYLAYGQILPADYFFQCQAGFELPSNGKHANETVFWRGAFGRTISTGVYGQAWSPMVELIGSKELVSGTDTDWDAIPQLQVALNRRQHVRLCFGAKIPLNNRDLRETEYMVYLLWDWFDGGFFEGW